MKLNRAFSLFELILVILISSIVLIYSSYFTKELHLSQKENEKIAILKLDLSSAKIIIEKNLPQIVDKLKYKNNTLYIDENILLKDVSSFKITKSSSKLQIDIKLDERIEQRWVFKL